MKKILRLLLNKNRIKTDIVAQGKYLPSLRELWHMGTTCFITLIAWVFFRADNITYAFLYLKNMFSGSLFSKAEVFPNSILALLIFFISIEWLGRSGEYAIK
jgi:hypothetical protein